MKKFILVLFFIFSLTLFSNDCVLNNIDLEKKIGQMIMIGIDGTELDSMNYLKDYVREGKIGGILFLGYNIKNKTQIKKLIKDIKSLNPEFPLFFAIDQEGGIIQRLNIKNGFSLYPSHQSMAQNYTTEQAYEIYYDLAKEISNIGFNVNFGPVIDLDINPECPVIGKLERSFSSDPKVVTNYATTFINAHNDNNIISVVKHFPGHGSSAADSHKGFTDVSSTWDPIELKPYSNLIDAKLKFAVMTSHIYNKNTDTVYPASLSKNHIDILKNDLGYKGLIFTDDLQMKAISDLYTFEEYILQSVNAGNDILLFSGFNYDNKAIPDKVIETILKFLEEKKIKNQTINESFIKIINAKNNF